jgi:germination protein M
VIAGHPGGSEAELMTVYSVVNSLTASFPAVKRVQILVEDKPAQTLAGHIDLTRPLVPDMTVLAASELKGTE